MMKRIQNFHSFRISNKLYEDVNYNLENKIEVSPELLQTLQRFKSEEKDDETKFFDNQNKEFGKIYSDVDNKQYFVHDGRFDEKGFVVPGPILGVDKLDRKKLFEQIKSCDRWLHDDRDRSTNQESLGMRRIINSIFEKKGWSRQDETANKKLLSDIKLLENTSMAKSTRGRAIIENGKRRNDLLSVYDENGNWNILSKLNTSVPDLSDLLTELIFRGLKKHETQEETLSSNRSYKKALYYYYSVLNNPKQGLMTLKPFLEQLLAQFFPGQDDFRQFTKFTSRNSELGARSEDRIVEYLTNEGFEIIYRGGDGDYLDMVFGLDLIVKPPQNFQVPENEKGLYKTVQIKTKLNKKYNRNTTTYELDDSYNIYRNKELDWICTPNPIEFFDLKTKQKLNI